MAHCTDAFGRGWSHMSFLLFRPFRFVFWLKMAVLHFLMIIMSSNPAGNINYDVNSVNDLESIGRTLADNIILVILTLIAVILLFLLVTFLSAAARILFYDGVREGSVYYGDAIQRNFGKIISYFLWNLIVGIIVMFLAMILVGIFAGILFGFGFLEGNQPSAPIIVILITLGIGLGIIMFLVIWFYFEILDAVVVPHMIVKDKGILSAWGFALGFVLENLFEFIGFMLLRLIVNIAVFSIVFIFTIIFSIFAIALSVPFAGGDFGFFASILFIILLLPIMAVYSFVFLPVPTFMSSYAYSFLSAVKDDDDYEPNSGLSPKPEPFTPPPTTDTPSNFNVTTTSTPEGPVSFKDLAEEHWETSSGSKSTFQNFDSDQISRENKAQD